MSEKSIAEGLADPDYLVRMRTIYLLVEQQHPEAVQGILPLLHDREMLVRNAAIVALGTLADSQAFDALVSCLNSHISLDRKNAVHAIVALGEPRRLDVFLDTLKTEKNRTVLAALIKAVSVFPTEEVLETVTRFLTDRDEDVRAVAATALGKMGLPAAIPALQHMALTDTNQETSIHNLWVINSCVARDAIQMILHPEQSQDFAWPDIAIS